MNASIKAGRVNGKITEVKEPQDQSNSKMGDHLWSTVFVRHTRKEHKHGTNSCELLCMWNKAFFRCLQVLRSSAPGITIECSHFCGEYIFCWAMPMEAKYVSPLPDFYFSNRATTWDSQIRVPYISKCTSYLCCISHFTSVSPPESDLEKL